MENQFTPVWGFGHGIVAIFFNSWDAISFINSDQRTLYLGTPMERPVATR